VGDWTLLAIGLALFSLPHMLSTTSWRDRLAHRLGRNAWRGLFSLVVLAGVTLIVMGYRQAPFTPVFYMPPQWMDYAPLAVMPLAFMLFVGSFASRDIRRITRHPQSWAVILWSLAHLAANGRAPDVALFGGLMLFALVMQPLSDMAARRRDPENWRKTAAETSALPFVALISGRAPAATGDLMEGAGLYGLLVFLGAFILHAWLFGIAVMPSIP